MPPISPCGMAVEWVRSCHIGGWRFYANNLDIVTRGRYYFVPKQTPHLPFPHDFGAFAWRNGDPEPDKRLGEIAKYPRSWSNGRLGIAIPPAVPYGQPGQFADEITWPFHAPPDQFSVMGIPSTCWTQVGSDAGAKAAICTLDSCCLQTAMARILELTYDGDSATVASFFTTWLGPSATVYYTPVAGLFPSRVMIKHPALTVIVLTGTTNFQQLALQAFQSLLGPTNLGAYGTLPLWNDLASRVSMEMQAAGCNASAPILVCGHSYGAAAATLLAARMRLSAANRDVCLMTFGCPKPGDSRLHGILSDVDAIHVSNDDDLVCALPPNLRELQPFIPLIGQPLLLLWASWQQPRERLIVDANGNTRPAQPAYLDAEVLGPLIVNVLASLPVPPIFGHRIHEYVRRLYDGCPDPCFPMNLALWRILFGNGVLELGGGRRIPRPLGGVKIGGGGELPPRQGLIVGGLGGVRLHQGGGVELGGGFHHTPTGGVELGGGGELELHQGGGVELGGGGELELHQGGGVELGGAGTLTLTPVPSSTCAGGGSFPFGSTFTNTIAAGAANWFKYTRTNGKKYTMTLNGTVNININGQLAEGTCGSLTIKVNVNSITHSANYTCSSSGESHMTIFNNDLGSSHSYSVTLTET